MSASLYASAGFLVLLALGALLLERLVTSQVRQVKAALRRTDEVLGTADGLRSDIATARQNHDRVADSVRGIADR
jgi:hypothetical protein